VVSIFVEAVHYVLSRKAITPNFTEAKNIALAMAWFRTAFRFTSRETVNQSREEKRLRIVFLAHYAAETGRSRQNTGPSPQTSTMPASDSRPAGLCFTFDNCVNIDGKKDSFRKMPVWHGSVRPPVLFCVNHIISTVPKYSSEEKVAG
jgi:hypothetical protein